MTEQERKLWYLFLKDYPIKFYKQRTINNYIADFYCAKAKLVIELDGSQHYNNEDVLKDKQRTEYLEQYGLKVLRFPNNYVNENFKGVCEVIDRQVKQSLSQLR